MDGAVEGRRGCEGGGAQLPLAVEVDGGEHEARTARIVHHRRLCRLAEARGQADLWRWGLDVDARVRAIAFTVTVTVRAGDWRRQEGRRTMSKERGVSVPMCSPRGDWAVA